MLVRRIIARPLFATAFVAEGVDTVRNPEPHVARTQAAYRLLASRVEQLPTLDHSQATLLVRAHGAAVATAGLALALGRAPRTAALALAALTLPVAAVNQPFVTGGEEDREPGQVSHASVVQAEQQARLERFLRNLSFIGGALLAALDREGRPGAVWRIRHARVDRAAMREARGTLKDARREARSALREVRRAQA